MKRKIEILLSTAFISLVICSVLCPSTAKAGIYNFNIDGVTWILTTFDDADGHVCLKVGNNETLYLDKDDESLASAGIINVGLDPNTGTIYVLDSNHDIRWWNYYLQDQNKIIFNFIPRPTGEDDSAYVDDVSDLILDYSNHQRLITGYKTYSGEVCPLLTLAEMKKILGIPEEQNPTPTPPYKSDTTAQNQQNISKQPVATQNGTQTTDTTSKTSNKVSIKKNGGYTCLMVGSKVVSKYKLKKGVLTWKGTKKSKKVKQVKQVGFIKKSKNLVYITKKGKVYTISKNGKTKTILKKGAKSFVKKNGFVTKVKKKSGYLDVTKK